MTSTITTRKTVANAFRTLGCLLLMVGLWTTNANGQVNNSESFDGATFVPTGWTNFLTSGTNTWTRVTAGTYPTQATHSGAGEAKFNSYSASGGIRSIITPVIDLSARGVTATNISFWMYRDNGYNTTADKIDVFYNTAANLTGATSLGTVNRAIGLAPIVGANGWYQYTFAVPGGFTGATNYLILRGTSAYGNNIYVDDVAWQSFPNVCTTPAPGNTLSTGNPVCSGASFTLSLQTATNGSGVTYQWESSPDGSTWSPIGGATNSSLATSQLVATYYHCLVTCSTGPNTTASNSLQVTMNTSYCECLLYCASVATSAADEDILNVTVGTMNNTSTCLVVAPGPGSILARYANYRGFVSPASITTGSSVSYSISIGTCGGNYGSGTAIFIDYNQDGDFLDPTEKIYGTPGTTVGPHVVSGSFTVDPSALIGTTAMRVINIESTTGAAMTGCSVPYYGETEDYCITIVAPVPCAGTPAPGNTIATPSSFCAGGTSTLSLQNATTGTGVTYQWFDSPDGSTWTPIGSATNSTYVTPSSFFDVFYQCEVTCSTGPSTGTSNSVVVTVVTSPVGGTATGPATGETYQNLAYNVTGTTGSLQWQYSTTAAAGPYTDIPGSTNAALNITANGGATYYIRCKAYNAGCTDAFSNVITTVVTVAGDNVCSANVLALGNNGPYSNVGATTEVGEPVPAATGCAVQTGWCLLGISNSVWFSYTPAVSGMYSFGRNGNLNAWDSQLALYAAESCGDILAAAGVQLAANDDSTTGLSPYSAWLAPVCLEGGTTYYLQVDGYSTSTNNNWGIRVTKSANVAPVIGACPSDITQCDNYTPTWTDPSATDDCGGATVVCSPASGSTFAAGTTSVTCTATDAESATSTCSFNVTINETPVIGACPANITTPNDAGTCTAVVTYTDPSATGTPAATVVCSPASGSTFVEGTTTVTCTASNICGSDQCSFTVTVNVNHATAATGITTNALYGQICSPAQLIMTATGGSLGTAGGDWVWYEGGCGAGASIGTGASITITPSVGVHNYYVRAEEPTCPANTNCFTVSINVITAPPSNTIHYTASITDGCVGAPAATFSVNAVANCTFYNWTSSQAGVRFNGNPSPYQTTVPTVSVTFVSLPAAGASGWSICVAGGNACGNTNTICTWVRATVSAPASITGSIIGCPGVTGQAYSSAAVAGAATYQWSSTGGIVINGNGAQAITVDFPGAFVSGTLSVRGQTACGYNGPNRTISINRAPAQPASITGPSYPCPNASSSYSVAAVAGAANYTWTTSVPGAIVTGTTNSCSIAFPAVIPAGSSVTVVANSSCPFPSAARSKGIASGIPNTPAPISGPASGQCGATGVSYSITPVALATGYSWTASCGTIQGPSNLSGLTIDWPASFTTCTLTVSATNACGSGGARALFVTGAPATPVSVSGNAVPCAGSTELYTASSIGATSYNWITPPGSSILGPINGSSIILLWGSTSGSVSAQAVNACGASGFRALACVISCRQSQVTGSASGLNAEVYPNPATEKATVKFSATTAAQYHLNMTNVLGQSVMTNEVAASEGINMIDLDLNNLAKGVYMLNIMSGDNNEQIRVVVE